MRDFVNIYYSYYLKFNLKEKVDRQTKIARIKGVVVDKEAKNSITSKKWKCP